MYPTPRDAMRAPPEDIAYVATLYVGTGVNAPDFLAVSTRLQPSRSR
ncbi:selenium-binding protein SBP56-related protein [Pyrobaculum sp.]